MYTPTLATLLLSSVALASPSKRAPALTVSLSHPKQVDSIKDIKISATVTNTGSEDIKVIKYGTVLDSDMPTRSFVVSKDGKKADFKGARLQLKSKLDGAATATIPAGKSVTVEHQIAHLYDFSALGTGGYSFEPVTTFQVLNGANSKREIVKVNASPINVHVAKDVASQVVNMKRSTVSCGDSGAANAIGASYSEGKSLASLAANYINSNGADSLFTSYWKDNSPSSIAGVFSTVANENDGARTLNCADPAGACSDGVIAYTYLTGENNIYYCDPFYSEVSTENLCSGTSVADRNIRGGTTLHELTHATSGTTDVGYGCSFDQSLSAGDAASNADNYNCFATQVYASTQC